MMKNKIKKLTRKHENQVWGGLLCNIDIMSHNIPFTTLYIDLRLIKYTYPKGSGCSL